MSFLAHQLIQPQQDQRVFFCGDVHGDLLQLEKKLKGIDFLEGEDMLIFSGDLIDRGDFSAELIEFVCSTPYVYSVLGNHEQSFIKSLDDPFCRQLHTSVNMGGQWIEEYDQYALDDLGELIHKNMSIALTVETSRYRIGVVHAAAPDEWGDVLDPTIENEDDWLWSRKQFNDTNSGIKHVVKGIDAVVHGHVCSYKTVSGNHLWIDTLFHTGSLTIMNASEIIEAIQNQA